MQQMSRRSLYPLVEPFDTGHFDTGDGHEIYYEQVGDPAGVPAVFLHGGPGGGGDVNARRFFDPEGYRAVLLDQRGSGRSRPHASLENNTTWHLIRDIEQLRTRLGIDRWLVFGGSWGSTLSLAYAQQHPGAVSGMLLRGIFLLRQKELIWFYQFGASELFPDRFAAYRDFIPEAERADLLAAYHRRLIGDDRALQLEAARRWSVWEGATSSLLPDLGREQVFGGDEFALALARIEAHYFVNRGFLEREDQLIVGAAHLAGIPARIVQGRYDVVCPAVTAWELAAAWPDATLEIIDDAGHSAFEPGIADALVRATDRFLAEGRP